MPLNTKAPLNQLVTMVSALPGMDQVIKGVPRGFDRPVVALVAFGGQTIEDKSTGVLERVATYFVFLGAAIEGENGDEEALAVSAAEDVLGDLVDAFIAAWVVDRRLAGTAASSRLRFDLANDPEYRIILGPEYRVFPLQVLVTQTQNF
jgi:hypothetical protein